MEKILLMIESALEYDMDRDEENNRLFIDCGKLGIVVFIYMEYDILEIRHRRGDKGVATRVSVTDLLARKIDLSKVLDYYILQGWAVLNG